MGQRPTGLKKYLSWSYFAALVASLGIAIGLMAAFRSFVQTGLRAEARLMTSYIATLERAYELENGKYIPFDLYGAAQDGQTYCNQPEGAARLGFLIRWCAGQKDTEPPRYTYKVETEEKGENRIRIFAYSGSDKKSQSFVCYGDTESDTWLMGVENQHTHLKDCE